VRLFTRWYLSYSIDVAGDRLGRVDHVFRPHCQSEYEFATLKHAFRCPGRSREGTAVQARRERVRSETRGREGWLQNQVGRRRRRPCSSCRRWRALRDTRNVKSSRCGRSRDREYKKSKLVPAKTRTRRAYSEASQPASCNISLMRVAAAGEIRIPSLAGPMGVIRSFQVGLPCGLQTSAGTGRRL
jgi:hypothetical protein